MKGGSDKKVSRQIREHCAAGETNPTLLIAHNMWIGTWSRRIAIRSSKVKIMHIRWTRSFFNGRLIGTWNMLNLKIESYIIENEKYRVYNVHKTIDMSWVSRSRWLEDEESEVAKIAASSDFSTRGLGFEQNKPLNPAKKFPIGQPSKWEEKEIVFHRLEYLVHFLLLCFASSLPFSVLSFPTGPKVWVV